MSRLTEFQEALSERVKGYFLLHLFINDIKFLVAFIILAPIAVGGVLLIPKIWTITPEDFTPKIKVSGIDFIQSWALARTARQQEIEGDFDAALYSWEVAISNYPTKTENLRSAIASFLKLDQPSDRQSSRNLNYSIWLLKLNKTNSTDLELVAETLDRSRLDQLQYSLLAPREKELTEPMRAAYSRSLFNLYRHQEFNKQWEKLNDSTRKSPKNSLYGTAYTALWGTPREIEENIDQLRKSVDQTESSLLAKQLLLLVYFHQENDSEYQNILNMLVSSGNARYSHHIGYWTLLTKRDKTSQALELAANHTESPPTVSDLVNHLTLLRGLGAPELADALIQKHIDLFPQDTYLYSAYADLLIELSDWNRLRDIAITLRKLTTDSRATSLSYYLEGTADAKQSRSNAATTAFEKFSSSVSDEGLGSEVGIAKELNKLGFPNHALKLLKQVESNYLSTATYWYTRAGFGFHTQDYSEMRSASEKALALEPDNVHYKSAVVESLLLLREDPSKAVRITLELSNKNPQSFSYLINHVIALTLNSRVEEAAELLRQIPEESAPDAQARTAYHYASFGVKFLSGDYQEAKKAAAKVPEELLSTREREWFDESRITISKTL